MAEAASGREGGTRGERTRESILDAAESVFASQSYAAARLEDVAQLVGIKRAGIVYYFRDKQALFEAVESRLYLGLAQAVTARMDRAATHTEELLALVDSCLDFMVERPSLARLILRNIADVYPASASDPVQYSRPIVEFFERIVAAGQAAGEFGPVNAMQLMQIVGGGILHYATTERLLGESRRYSMDDTETKEVFRALLHKTTLHLVSTERLEA
jgi:TetR/AcrR family transcriptional regulator